MFILYDYKCTGILRIFKKCITSQSIILLVVLPTLLLLSCFETVTESFKPVPYISGTIWPLVNDSTMVAASIIIQNSSEIPDLQINNQELRLNRDDDLLEYEGYINLVTGDTLNMEITFGESLHQPIIISWSDIIPDSISLVDSGTSDLIEGESKTLHWSQSANADFYYLYFDLTYYSWVNDTVVLMGVHSFQKYATDTLYAFAPDFYMPEWDNWHISQANISVRPIAGPVPYDDLGNISGDAAGFVMVSGKGAQISFMFEEPSQD